MKCSGIANGERSMSCTQVFNSFGRIKNVSNRLMMMRDEEDHQQASHQKIFVQIFGKNSQYETASKGYLSKNTKYFRRSRLVLAHSAALTSRNSF